MKENASRKRTKPGQVPSSRIHTRSQSHRPKPGDKEVTGEAGRRKAPAKKKKHLAIDIAPGTGLDPDVVLTPI
jgi:hypothetical protein